MKGYYKITVLISLGFFTMGLMDPLYDTYVPIFLDKYIDLKSIIGGIMTLDNIFAIFLIPVVAAWSDKVRTPIGRRMPFIIITLPITAVLFALLPFAYLKSLFFLIAAVFLLNIFKQAARGPVVALMPDTVPSVYHSQANGIINTLGGLAAIVGTVILARLMDVSISLPLIGDTKDKLPFVISGILVILAVLVLFLFVKEKTQEKTKEDKAPIMESVKIVFADKDKSTVLILVSLFMWFLAYQGILPFLGLYTIEFMKVTTGTAALSAGMVAISYTLCAVFSGMIAARFGRKHTIRFSLAALVVILALLFLHESFSAALSPEMKLYSFWGLLFLFGSFWVSVVTNSFPMLWQMASYSNLGIYTGLYYTFSQAAAITAPFLTGILIDTAGYRSIFAFASVCMLAAYFIMAKVKKGEAVKN